MLTVPSCFADTSKAASSALPVSTEVAADPVSHAGLNAEMLTKVGRVQQFLREQKLGGILLTRVNNFSWMTAGLADNAIVLTSEIGAASLLVMADGHKYLIGSNIEVPRHMREDLAGLGFEPREYTWFAEQDLPDAKLAAIQELAKGRVIGTDVPFADLKQVEREFAHLRFELTPTEIEKYRWVGRNSTEAVIAVCRKLRPGMSERQMEQMASDELMRRGLRPTVLLMGVDHRVFDFYHHKPTDLRLQNYAIVNVCARRWGLVASVARFVHFGPVPPALERKLLASAKISAEFQAHSRPGVTAAQMMSMAVQWYADAGFPNAWLNLHQGGAIGYAEREWLASPGSPEVIHDHQAFAWNPNVEGALSFDTVVVEGNRVENLTQTPDWPTVPVTIDGVVYKMPDILVR